MAKAKTVDAPVLMETKIAEVAADPLPEPKFCETCIGWTSNNGIYGQCLPSGKFLSAPIVTTNFTSCKNWSKRV